MSHIENSAAEARPADHLYEIRAADGTVYRATGELVLKDGWFTVRDSDGVTALQIAAHRVKAARLVDPAELEAEAPGPVDYDELIAAVDQALGIDITAGAPDMAGWLFTACRELLKSEAARAHLRDERAEARMWARHGYKIGQKHCGWSDHGVAPAWLTEGWPNSFDSCEHLTKAAEYDTALGRVLEVAASLESAEAHGGAWDANQQAAQRIRVAVGRTLPDEEGRS